MDFEKARHNMIEQQIRPWNVLDQSVLDLLVAIKRENFLPDTLKKLAFVDKELPIQVNGQDTGQHMLAPKLEARLLQNLHLEPHEKVLEIGTGTGYMAALMAQKCAQVTTVEANPSIAKLASDNLKNNHISRVKVIEGCGYSMAKELGSFDVIVQSGASEIIPETLLAQLKPGGRFIGIVGKQPVLSATLVDKAESGVTAATPLFETSADYLANSPKAAEFEF
ncbi:MAG: protein-L-isoaspartate O-methyltransferase [Limnobacter sp.]|nr:protein-L-isoaspartate O-methyltransferase [Limnobacter sp.]